MVSIHSSCLPVCSATNKMERFGSTDYFTTINIDQCDTYSKMCSFKWIVIVLPSNFKDTGISDMHMLQHNPLCSAKEHQPCCPLCSQHCRKCSFLPLPHFCHFHNSWHFSSAPALYASNQWPKRSSPKQTDAFTASPSYPLSFLKTLN